MARKLNIMENEKHTLQELEYWDKTEKCGKGDTDTVGLGI